MKNKTQLISLQVPTTRKFRAALKARIAKSQKFSNMREWLEHHISKDCKKELEG